MYEDIILTIDEVIEDHKLIPHDAVKMTEQEKHYFIQGLEVAKQIVKDTEKFVIEEIAYETFEDTVRALKNNLDRNDMEVIIEDIFMDEYEEDEE